MRLRPARILAMTTRLAVLADVHADAGSLRKALWHIDRLGCERFGD